MALMNSHPPHACGPDCHPVDHRSVISAVERECISRGLRFTPQRRAVLTALAASKAPLGAYDLIEALRVPGVRSPAPIAIYRALDFLREQGFIHRLESLNAFLICPHRHDHASEVVFLICETCRRVEEAITPKLDAALLDVARRHGFTPARQVVELAGRCRTCQTAS